MLRSQTVTKHQRVVHTTTLFPPRKRSSNALWCCVLKLSQTPFLSGPPDNTLFLNGTVHKTESLISGLKLTLIFLTIHTNLQFFSLFSFSLFRFSKHTLVLRSQTHTTAPSGPHRQHSYFIQLIGFERFSKPLWYCGLELTQTPSTSAKRRSSFSFFS